MRAIARAGLLVLLISGAGCLPDLESECASSGECPEAAPLCVGGVCTGGSGDGGRFDGAPPNDGAPDRAVGDGGRVDLAVGDGDVPDGCVVVGREVCNGVDDDCNGRVDEEAEGVPLSRSCYTGDPATQNQGLCRPGRAQCLGGGYGACEGEVVPVDEVCGDADRVCSLCNSQDDDCDGMTDEGLVRACGPESSIGVCRPGSERCGVGGWLGCEGAVEPGVEICDGLDNDCDLEVDGGLDDCQCVEGESQDCYSGPANTEGVGICDGGTQSCSDQGTFGRCEGEVRPGVETCNLVDDDCDGRPDEDTGGAMCSVGVGVCRRAGVLQCPPDAMELRCDAVAGEPQAEQCNTLDDDCDGSTDEGQAGTVCNVGVGECRAQGRIVCVVDGPPRCEGVPGNPQPEVCNGDDDDCDGRTDEGNGEGEDSPLSRGCYPGPGGTEGVGICQGGTQVCNGGVYGACNGATLPLPERCNGIDDNCDLIRDNLAVGACGCLLGMTRNCYSGPGGTVGIGPCRRGEQACVEAADGSTSFSPCVGEVVPSPEICNGVDDDCNGLVDGDADAICPDAANAISRCVAAACDFNCQPTWVDRNANSVDGCERGCGARPAPVAIAGPPGRLALGVHVAAMPGGAHWAAAYIGDDGELYVSSRGGEAVAVLLEAAIAHELDNITGLELIAGAQGYTVMLLSRGQDEAVAGLLVDLTVVADGFAVAHTMSFGTPTRPILVRSPVAGDVDDQLVVGVITRIIDEAELPFALRRPFGGDAIGPAEPLRGATDGWTGWPLLAGTTLDGEAVLVSRAPVGVGMGRFEARALFVASAQQVSVMLPPDLRGEPSSITLAARDDADRIAVVIKQMDQLLLGAVRGGGNPAVLAWSSAQDAPALTPHALVYGLQGPVLLASRPTAQALVEGVAVPIETLGNAAPLRVNGPHAITPANVAGVGLTGALVGADRRVAWFDANRQVRTAVLPCQ